MARLGPGPGPGPAAGRRLLIAAAVARHLRAPELDKPTLVGARSDIIDLFTRTLGYTLLPEPGIDPSEADLTQRMRALCRQRIRPDDHLVMYLSCHGQILENGRHVLMAADADPDDEAFLLPTVRLAEAMLLDTPLRRLLLVLDTCYSGQGGNQAAAAALSSMERDWTGPSDSGLVVVAATRPFEQAHPGALPRLLAEAVDAPSTAGRIPAALDLGAVVGAMNANPARPAHQHIGWTAIGLNGPVPAFLPNPRHRPDEAGLDLRFQGALSWESEADRREAEFRTRFLPSAKGTLPDDDGVPAADNAPGPAADNGAWWFTGRHAALTDVSRWLASPSPAQPALVVTAGPGVGKTALLGLVAALAEPARRRSVPVDGIGLPAGALPPSGAVDIAVYAGGLTVAQIRVGIAAALGTAENDTTGLIAALRARLHRTERPFTLLIDALDEAADPHELITFLLRPLLAAGTDGHGPPVRMLLGTRPHLLPLLEPGGEQALYGRATGWPRPHVIDLGDERYADPDGLLRYTIRCLLDGHRASPYRLVPPAHARAAAQAVVRAAAGSFLVARIVAGTLAARDTAADPADARWVRSLPSMVGPAMQADLDSRLGAAAGRAEDLLRPLAYALGQGLPWAGVWASLAAKVSGRTYTDADLEWLQAHAGAYVVESQEAGRSVYRLYHQALADHLRGGSADARSVHRAFVEVLSDVPYGVDATRDWSRAHPYALRHLGAHAVASGRIDTLVSDVGYLVHSDPEGLLSALPHTRTAFGRTVRAVYTASAVAHRGSSPARRHRLLALDAARYRATGLARGLNDGLAVRPRWATGGMLNPFAHSVIAGSSSQVAHGEVDGSAVLVTGLDTAVAVLDLVTGRAKAVFTGHRVRFGRPGPTVACGTVDGEPVGVSRLPGDDGDEVLVWDLRTGIPRCALVGHPSGLSAMTCTTVDDAPVVVTAVDDRIMVWDLRTGSMRAELGDGVRAVACAEVDGIPVAVTASEQVRLFNLRTLEEMPTPIAPRSQVVDMACLVVDGVVLLVVGATRGFGAAMNDGRISVWELATGHQRETPLPAVTTIDTVHCTYADGIPVAVTSGAGNTLVWDLREGPDLAEPIEGPAFDNAAVAVGRMDGTPVAATVGGEDWGDGMHIGQVLLWNLRDGSRIADIRGHSWPVQRVALAGAGSGTSLLVLTAGSGRPYPPEPEVQVWDSATRTARDLVRPAETTLQGVADVDGRSVAVFVEELPDERHRAVLRDVTDDQEVGRFGLGAGTTAIAPVTGTPVLLTARRIEKANPETAHALRVWDLRTRRCRAEYRLPRHEHVSHLETALVNGRPSAVVVYGDGHFAVVDLHDGRCAASFGTTGPADVLACTNSPLYSLAALVTKTDRQLIEIRDLRSGTLRDAFPTPYPVTALAFDAESLVVAADREVLVLDIDAARLP
ncbi:hypothetical protein [Actinacidiphila acididurans]|uniref:Peptidase C14 caspase domain-containing protein n=1 Tax=Actinacidiphila acididurans TaxID=2784346 RepID=A0ABS2TU94_9ACTN|nr:hypothetical protein [Actinacidiphila acididurans]MBM9506904.1 hypothetical protein [Actinacidiphila acididurans]